MEKIVCLITSFSAVSYTHLDVYKRQLFMFLLTIIWLVILLLFVNNSYRNNLSDLQQTVRAALHYTCLLYTSRCV